MVLPRPHHLPFFLKFFFKGGKFLLNPALLNKIVERPYFFGSGFSHLF